MCLDKCSIDCECSITDVNEDLFNHWEREVVELMWLLIVIGKMFVDFLINDSTEFSINMHVRKFARIKVCEFHIKKSFRK